MSNVIRFPGTDEAFICGCGGKRFYCLLSGEVRCASCHCQQIPLNVTWDHYKSTLPENEKFILGERINQLKIARIKNEAGGSHE